MSTSDWRDLPSDIWDLIVINLISLDELCSVACAAEALAALGKVSEQPQVMHTFQNTRIDCMKHLEKSLFGPRAQSVTVLLLKVCKHTRRLAAERWESLAAGCPSVPPCPLTSLPFVFGLDR